MRRCTIPCCSTACRRRPTWSTARCRTTSTTRSIAESTYQTSGVTAESSGGGVRVNMIPKDGGNAVHGHGFFGGAADSWHLQADNLTPDLVARGLKTGARIQHVNDFNGAVGGPIVKDKLWYFGSGRYQSTFLQIPNTFNTDGSPGIEDADIKSFVVRGTWQATPRNKFAALYQRNYKWKGHEISSGGQTGLPQPRTFPRRGAIRSCTTSDRSSGRRPSPTSCSRRSATRPTSCTIRASTNRGSVRQRGTPAWFATATPSEHDHQPAHRGRPVQSMVLSQSGQRRRRR